MVLNNQPLVTMFHVREAVACGAANAWITSSSSTRVTCGASSRGVFNIITGPGHICHSTSIVRSLAAYSLPLRAISSRSPRWVVCIIATNVARHDRSHPLRREGSPHFSTVVLIRNGAQNFHSSRASAPVADVPDFTDRNSNAKYIFEQRQR
jgi:hypothetical protein